MAHPHPRAAALLAIVLAIGCSDSSGPERLTTYGAPVALGNGQARTYIVVENGAPTELGIALSETALDGLPAPTGGFPDSHVFLLSLPSGSATGYQVVELDWNPAGHPPPMVYTVPHFDFHFYTQSAADRGAIVPNDPNFATKAANLPPANLRPSGYVVDEAAGVVAAVPLMGVHWLAPSSPEFHGSAFTSTFIYGSWDGHFTFVEPMVAYDYLKSKPDSLATISVPTGFESSGVHPTGYRVAWDQKAREYRIGITGLRPHGT